MPSTGVGRSRVDGHGAQGTGHEPCGMWHGVVKMFAAHKQELLPQSAG